MRASLYPQLRGLLPADSRATKNRTAGRGLRGCPVRLRDGARLTLCSLPKGHEGARGRPGLKGDWYEV